MPRWQVATRQSAIVERGRTGATLGSGRGRGACEALTFCDPSVGTQLTGGDNQYRVGFSTAKGKLADHFSGVEGSRRALARRQADAPLHGAPDFVFGFSRFGRVRAPGPPTCPSWASISGCQHVAGAISGMDALECCAQPRLRRVQRAQQCGRRLHFGSRQRARERSTRSVLSCGQTTHRVGASVPWSIMM